MTTPVRSQYLRIKRQHSDAILLFRLGDFYETFDEDAKLLSSELDIVLTSREVGKGEKVPLAGIPYHALDGYLSRLVKKGHKPNANWRGHKADIYEGGHRVELARRRRRELARLTCEGGAAEEGASEASLRPP